MKTLFLFVVLLCIQTVVSQAISGTVYDDQTGDKIQGVSVYFANTSIGTITDDEGYFSIDPKFNSNTYLVISHIGYLTKTIEYPEIEQGLRITLTEDFFEVPEVVVVSDPFSRRQKLLLFRAEFLGDKISAEHCTIKNEDAIELYFNSTTNTLEAYAKEPILVQNEYLGYTLKFDLKEFKVIFKKKTLERIDNIESTIILGHTFFDDFGADNIRFVLRRNDSYKGSVQHFMRTLWNQNWADETFEFREEYKKIDVFNVVSASIGSSLFTKKIIFKRKRIRIKHKKGLFNYWSTLEILSGNKISIDQYGSYMPYSQLKFGGYMASLRIGDLLPLDYNEEIILD